MRDTSIREKKKEATFQIEICFIMQIGNRVLYRKHDSLKSFQHRAGGVHSPPREENIFRGI